MKQKEMKNLVGKIAINSEGDRHIITDFHHQGYVMINGVWKGAADLKKYKIVER